MQRDVGSRAWPDCVGRHPLRLDPEVPPGDEGTTGYAEIVWGKREANSGDGISLPASVFDEAVIDVCREIGYLQPTNVIVRYLSVAAEPWLDLTYSYLKLFRQTSTRVL